MPEGSAPTWTKKLLFTTVELLTGAQRWCGLWKEPWTIGSFHLLLCSMGIITLVLSTSTSKSQQVKALRNMWDDIQSARDYHWLMNLLITILNLQVLEKFQIPKEINAFCNSLTLIFILIITCISYLGKKATFPVWVTLLPMLKSAFPMFAKLIELSQHINREVLVILALTI